MDDISTDAILRQTPWCVTREQEGQYLIYNVQTDEMHLIPPAGFYVYQLCDGLRSVGELEAQLVPAFDASDQQTREHVRDLVVRLVTRGILAEGGDDGSP